MNYTTAILVALLLSACNAQNGETPAQSAAQPNGDQDHAHAGAPSHDFSALVQQHGAEVVNISTSRTLKRSALPGLRDQPEFDPFFEFFRRFLPPHANLHEQSLGSGFIIDSNGYVLTNAHVVDDADEVVVRLSDRREFSAKLVGADKRTDVALLKIDTTGLPSVHIGDPARIKVGAWVVAIGAPFGFDNSVTAGIVSAKARTLPNEGYVPFLQTDVAINPGNSGGPLFDLRGEVIGINSQIYSRSGGYMGVSFAIPINIAMSVADQLRQFGEVRRGQLGVRVQDVDAALAAAFGLQRPDGALIAEVERRSPAARAGLRAGDVVLGIDDEAVHGAGELAAWVAAHAPGTSVKLRIWRDSSETSVQATLGKLS